MPASVRPARRPDQPLSCCDLVLILDAAGRYACGNDLAGARAAYEASVGRLDAGEGFQLVRLAVRVPPPTLLELACDATPDESPLAGLGRLLAARE